MFGLSADGLSYLLDDDSNNFVLNPGFLASFPDGLLGLKGNDTIIGSSSPEKILGNEDQDFLLGGDDYDTLLGGTGNDLLLGNKGNDALWGESGNDFLSGGKGNDFLLGGLGNDTLTGEKGLDTLIGSQGKDVFILTTKGAVANRDQADIINDFNPLEDQIGLSENLTESQLTLELLLTNNNQVETVIKITESGQILGRILTNKPEELMGKFIAADGLLVLNQTPINSPSPSPQFNPYFGYGLVDAATAVSQALGVSTFPDVSNLGGDEWPRDLIKAPEVWAQGITGKGVVIAVIDSGVDYHHPELKNNIWSNPGETGIDEQGQEKSRNGMDDDRNGFIDDFQGWNFLDSNNNPMDLNGHGTHIAGLMVAQPDGVGITGVAPDAKIMPLRVLNSSGSGSGGNSADAIRYAVKNGADIINISLGGEQLDSGEFNAIQEAQQKGVLVVSASGNKEKNLPEYPARFADKFGLAVGSVDINNQFSYFSNRAGSTPINYVVGPGGTDRGSLNDYIYSTAPTALFPVNYRYLAGSSMAVPHVSGLAALMLEANPLLKASELIRIITKTANPLVKI